jgi:hypothetical protein
MMNSLRERRLPAAIVNSLTPFKQRGHRGGVRPVRPPPACRTPRIWSLVGADFISAHLARGIRNGADVKSAPLKKYRVR